MNKHSSIGKNVTKIDGLSLATGNARFTDDFIIPDTLEIVFLYSPHAFAKITRLDTGKALSMNGVVDVLSYQNTPATLHTTAGQGYPEPSPYDTRLFDSVVRFVGDRVVAVVAETKEIAREALSVIEVEYEVMEPVFDIDEALLPGASQIHESDKKTPIGAPYDPQRNLAAEVEIGFGDMQQGFSEADEILQSEYENHYGSHAMLEPHTVKSYLDENGRIVLISATQVPFHARRIVSMVLDIPLSQIRVIKPRIGGGFGGKQEVFLEQVAAFVTFKHKRAARIFFSRKEVFVSSRTRHPIRTALKIGIKKDGEITAIDMDCLMNTGAYGSHALTVLSNAGSKVLPLFNKVKHVRFFGQSVYTNLPIGGAYRGYGATQSYFALNCEIDKIVRKAGVDILEYYKKWHIKLGETSPIFEQLGEGKAGVKQNIKSCKLDECIDLGAEAIGWSDKRDKKLGNGKNKIRGVGSAIAMQGSGIPLVDMGSASMKMNEDGSFNLFVGATDLGTGSDTVLAQIAAEVLQVPVEKILVLSSDTDLTPFDVGAYASSTTYVSGKAVEKCAIDILHQIKRVAVDILQSGESDLVCENENIVDPKANKSVSFSDICQHSMYTANQSQIQAFASNVPVESPPPFIAQFAEVEVDIATGIVKVLQFVSAVDCGQAIHPRLAEGQVDGSVINGISYALTEQYHFDAKGRMLNPAFSHYKLFTAADLPIVKTILVESWEETGPYGAKSIGEIAMNGPLPAIANAIYDAVGIRLNRSPFRPEVVWKKLQEANNSADQ